MKILRKKAISLLIIFGVFLGGSCDMSPPSEPTEQAQAVVEEGLPVQKVADEPKSYPPVYNGPRLMEGDPMLRYEAAAKEITSNVYSDTPNRVFRQGWVSGDSARFQLVEDWTDEHNVWKFDYAQTGGDFSELAFPQIGQGDVVTELHRDYSFKAGELFFVSDAIFCHREDGSEVIHINKYVFEQGRLVSWYRDVKKHQIAERFFSVADNLFPSVDGFPLLQWAGETFADPLEAMEGFANLEAKGTNQQMALGNWITLAVQSTAVITTGESIGWTDASQPVVWLEFGPGRNQMGAAFVLDAAEEGNQISVYDALLIGIANANPRDCKDLGDVVVSLDWAKRTQRAYLIKELIHPDGMIYGDPSSESVLNDPDTERLIREDLNEERLPRPLYFGSYNGNWSFDEAGFASWEWWLPGSSEKIIVQKTDEGIFWRGFEGTYH